jgi:hypothetical protein
MYMLGHIPDDDDDFLQVVETRGKWVEEYKWRTKDRTSRETKPNKNSTDKNTNKEQENKKENMKENKKDYNKDENIKEVKDRKSKDKRFSSTKEALNGISEELIQKHKAANATCWRCGRSNHYTTECYAKIADGGESLEKSTVSSQRKRQRSDEENEVEKENTNTKKAKIAAVRVEPEIAAERRIWEMDTDAEEDF